MASEGSNELPGYYWNLGNCYYEYWKITENLEDFVRGKEAYQKACLLGESRSLEASLKASYSWADWALVQHNWEEVIMASQYGIAAINELIKNQNIRSHKESWIREAKEFPSIAAYALTKVGRIEEAVDLLENNRTYLLADSIKVRMDEDIRYSSEERNSSYLQSFYHHLSYEQILNCANDNPITYLIPTNVGGVAFTIFNQKTNIIWIDTLRTDALLDRIFGGDDANDPNGYFAVYSQWRENTSDQDLLSKWKKELDETCSWLWDICMGQVTQYFVDEKIDHSLLIPVGFLSQLPLHAAWNYSQKENKRNYAMDHVSFTYAPSAHALITTNLSSNLPINSILAISIVDEAINSSEEEVAAAVAYFDDSKVLYQDEASLHKVKKIIPSYSTLHFSTHGISDYFDPLSSKLKLFANEYITLQELLDLKLSKTRLVVLSACETSVPGLNLPNEVISLSSGFIQIGVPGVVGSLWLVSDSSTMILMVKFYHLMQKEKYGPIDALWLAQTWMKNANQAEKEAWFLEAYNNNSIPAATANKAIKELIRGKDFSHPFYWAGFQYLGR